MTDSEVKTKEKTTEPQQTKAVEKASTEPSFNDRLLKSLDDLVKNVSALNDRVSKMEESAKSPKEKAMETPTDLPLEPAQGSSPTDNDIGAKVQAHNREYHGQSIQAGIDDASPGNPNQTDKPDLKMEQKSVISTTETPRPPQVSGVNKSSDVEPNPILKRFRELGYQQGMEEVAREIKKGLYHNEQAGWRVY